MIKIEGLANRSSSVLRIVVVLLFVIFLIAQLPDLVRVILK